MTTAMDPTSGALHQQAAQDDDQLFPEGRRPVRPAPRIRRVRRRLHRRPQGPQIAPHRQGRALHPREPRASRRRGCRSHRRRRRGHPDPDSARVPGRGVRQARHQAAEARPLRGRPHLHAAGRAAARALRARVEAADPRAGPGVPGLALGARHRHQAVRHGAGDRAGASADLHRPAEVDQEPGRIRAQALPDPQDRLQRHLRRLQGRRHRPLHRVAVEPHAGLQGHVPVLSGEGLLRRPVGRAADLGDGAGASALLDQHLPVVEAGASLSHGRPQRRDQHAARQRQLDGGAAGVGLLAAVRRRDLQAVADLLRGPVRHGLLRQRARVPGDGRLQPGARRHDADPRGVGRQSADGFQAARVLRVSRLPDGAVGRPGGDGLHRRPPDRRHARPQRPAAGALSRDQGRHGDHVVGGGRAAGRGSQHRQEVAAAARQDAADRPGGRQDHLRRRSEGGSRLALSLRAMAEAHADPGRRPAAAQEARRARRPTWRCSICSRRSATRRRASSS